MNTPNALYRRAAYGVVSAVLLILGAIGIITAEQLDTWLGVAYQIGIIVGGGSLAVATAKTKPGSDDPATQADIIRAYSAATPASAAYWAEPAAQAPLGPEERQEGLGSGMEAQTTGPSPDELEPENNFAAAAAEAYKATEARE